MSKYESLPLEEWMKEMGNLTQEQIKEYLSKLPINESYGAITPIKVDPTFDKGVDIDDILDEFD